MSHNTTCCNLYHLYDTRFLSPSQASQCCYHATGKSHPRRIILSELQLNLATMGKSIGRTDCTILNPVNIADDSYIAIEKSQEVSSSSFKYITTLKFTTLQISHGGQYKCQAGFRSQTAENVTYLVVKSKWRTLKTTRILN